MTVGHCGEFFESKVTMRSIVVASRRKLVVKRVVKRVD